MRSSNKKKPGRIIIVILVVIGSVCVLDNCFRLTCDISKAIVKTVKHHSWSTVVVK
jgi:hypothetical protein